jgi:hypothetical protein
MSIAGDTEGWAFGGWSPVHPLPAVFTHCCASGARDLFRTDGVLRCAQLPSSCFQPPPGSLESTAGAEWSAAEPSPFRLPVERSRSGHLLVRITLDGAHSGLAILDTGASGFVVSRAFADAAGCAAFGEVFVSGVSQKMAARYRRCASLTLGPLRFAAPLMLELELANLVYGASGPCVAIVGFDLFRRAVVDFPPSPAGHVTLSPAACYSPQPALPWVACSLLSSVPHVWCRWAGLPPGTAELLLLDTGAGGADSIFHARSCARLGLREAGTYQGESSITGVTASTPPRAAMGLALAKPEATQKRQLDWLELLPARGRQAPVRFEGPVEVLLLGQKAQFDLSEHMAGVVGTSLLCRTRFVCDYGRRRVAFVEEG